jgi:Flp pilus assembly protein CpaB
VTYRLRNIVLAVGLAALAAALTSFYVANYKDSVRDAEKNVVVWVAAKDIPVGTSGSAVKRGMLVKQEVARKSVVPGAIASPADLGDKIATERVYAGEQVSARRFLPVEQRGVRAELKGNQRAIQVPGDVNQLLAGTLKTGDHVDVVSSLKYKVDDVSSTSDASEAERVASRVVLRDLRVLHAPSGSLAAQKVGSAVDSYSVQLAVTDSQAQKLFFVMKNGDWSLQLRPVVDATDSPESVETIESVLGDGLRPRQFLQLAGR